MTSDEPDAGWLPPHVASQMTAEDVDEDEGGFDYGWPDATVALADPLFSNLLMDAQVDAVGYASVRGVDGKLTPKLLLTGKKEGPLREVFALFARWQTLSGPGATRLEIAFDGAGFRIAVLPDARALRWRCCGFGNVSRPNTFNLAWVKPIDTRGDFLDSLSAYGRGPFAPVYLGAALAQIDGNGLASACEIVDVPHLVLPSVPIYCRPEDIPTGSFLAGGEPHDNGTAAPLDPSLVAAQRAWRLPTVMPKTVHVLRHTEAGRSLVDRVTNEGVVRWQVEQAVCNLRLGALAEPGDAPPHSHWMETHSLRLGHIELAEQRVDLEAWTVTEILEQVRRDTRFLLRRIDSAPSTPTLASSQDALRKAGYA